MTKEQLGRKSTRRASVEITHRSLYTGNTTKSVFTDILHFFNDKDEEIGYVAFPHSICETVITFNPPRKWSRAMLATLQ